MSFFSKNRRLVILFSVLAFVVALGVFLPTYEKEKGLAEGIVLSSIELNSFGNEHAQTLEEVTKKPYVLLHFFTLECPYCKYNISHLNRLNKSEKVSVIGYISITSKKARAYAREHGVQYTLSRASKEYMEIFNPVVVPMSFLVDTKTLEVKSSFIGKISEKDVLSYIE